MEGKNNVPHLMPLISFSVTDLKDIFSAIQEVGCGSVRYQKCRSIRPENKNGQVLAKTLKKMLIKFVLKNAHKNMH
jgi:hypothetical protein